MIFVVSGVTEDNGLSFWRLEEPMESIRKLLDDRARDELDFTSLRLELLVLREVEVSGVAVELDKFAELVEANMSRLDDELEISSAEALLPSSPQATNPNATANTPNKPKSFIFPSLFRVNIIEISLKSCR